MYTIKNYKSKKELVADVKNGKRVDTFQPGGIFPAQKEGTITLEGPHYPQPHRWDATAVVRDGIVVKVK